MRLPVRRGFPQDLPQDHRHVACAEKQSWQSAALIPFILFAEIDIPIPVPQMMIPLSHSPEATAFAAACPYTG